MLDEPPPITCVTAIASPSARLSPRIIVAAMPGRVDGRTTPRTISQRVVPSASAPSLSSLGTLRKSSRLIVAMIGTTMIVRIEPAVKSRPVDGGAAEERDPAEHRVERRLDVVAHERAEDEDPPEPEHDARDRGEHLDERADHAADAARREQAEEERDRDRERAGDQRAPSAR